jgi:serine/threonine protein kinase
LQRTVALKLLFTDTALRAEQRFRFPREVRSAAAVNHPNIVAVFEIGEVDGEVFIAMDRVDGRSLRATKAALPEAEAARIARRSTARDPRRRRAARWPGSRSSIPEPVERGCPYRNPVSR